MTENPLHEAAAILAGWPRLVENLRATHVRGPDGRCRGCSSQVSASPRWPCALAALAEAARTRRAQAATHGHTVASTPRCEESGSTTRRAASPHHRH